MIRTIRSNEKPGEVAPLDWKEREAFYKLEINRVKSQVIELEQINRKLVFIQETQDLIKTALKLKEEYPDDLALSIAIESLSRFMDRQTNGISRSKDEVESFLEHMTKLWMETPDGPEYRDTALVRSGYRDGLAWVLKVNQFQDPPKED